MKIPETSHTSASIQFEATSTLFALHEDFYREWIQSGLVSFTYGRWIKVDPSRFSECCGQCWIEMQNPLGDLGGS